MQYLQYISFLLSSSSTDDVAGGSGVLQVGASALGRKWRQQWMGEDEGEELNVRGVLQRLGRMPSVELNRQGQVVLVFYRIHLQWPYDHTKDCFIECPKDVCAPHGLHPVQQQQRHAHMSIAYLLASVSVLADCSSCSVKLL